MESYMYALRAFRELISDYHKVCTCVWLRFWSS